MGPTPIRVIPINKVAADSLAAVIKKSGIGAIMRRVRFIMLAVIVFRIVLPRRAADPWREDSLDAFVCLGC